MGKIINKHLVWPCLFMGLIFIESSIPMDGGPEDILFLTNLNPQIQNLLHIPLYGILAFLWMGYFSRAGIGERQMAVFSLLITIFYGCLDEIHQTFVPGRYGGLMDIYLDSIGAVLGVIVFRRFRQAGKGEKV